MYVTMAAICIGPVCIPYSAFVPFFYFLWVPLYKWLQNTFPSWFPKAEKNKKAKSEDAPAADKRDKRSKSGAMPSSSSSKENTGNPTVIVLGDDEEWPALVKRAEVESKVIVADFTATW